MVLRPQTDRSMGSLRSLRRWKQKLAVAEKPPSLEWDDERVDSGREEDTENADPKEVPSPSSVRSVRVREEHEWVVHQEEIYSSAFHQRALDANPISSPWFGACCGTSSDYATLSSPHEPLGLGLGVPMPPSLSLVKTPPTLGCASTVLHHKSFELRESMECILQSKSFASQPNRHHHHYKIDNNKIRQDASEQQQQQQQEQFKVDDEIEHKKEHETDTETNTEYYELPKHPDTWPQNPLLLRATPGCGMMVTGIRRHSEPPNTLSSWEYGTDILPINTGWEPPGRAWVVDFESPLFVGTLLLRIRNSSPIQTNSNNANDTTDDETEKEAETEEKEYYYFRGLNRTYQAVVQGRLRKQQQQQPLMIQDLVTGIVLKRPISVQGQKWLLWRAATSLVKLFAPQLNVKPNSWTSPLATTPQSILSQPVNMEGIIEEPLNESPSSILSLLHPTPNKNDNAHHHHHPRHAAGEKKQSVMARVRHRKKIMGQLHGHSHSLSSTSGGSKQQQQYKQKEKRGVEMNDSWVYTFEFLQHLVHFDDNLSLKLSANHGISLGDFLHGQPLQIMARHETTHEVLWAFDVWHSCLYPDALLHHQKKQQQQQK